MARRFRAPEPWLAGWKEGLVATFVKQLGGEIPATYEAEVSGDDLRGCPTRGEINLLTTSISLRFALVFAAGGVLEIAGGYLVWLWLREGRPATYGLTGALMLVLFGVVLTFVPTHFGRAYAAYGGVFVVMSLFWGWLVDGRAPDRMDVIGTVLVLIGVGVMLVAPRT